MHVGTINNLTGLNSKQNYTPSFKESWWNKRSISSYRHYGDVSDHKVESIFTHGQAILFWGGFLAIEALILFGGMKWFKKSPKREQPAQEISVNEGNSQNVIIEESNSGKCYKIKVTVASKN